MSADIEHNSPTPFNLYHQRLTGLLIIHTIQIQHNATYYIMSIYNNNNDFPTPNTQSAPVDELLVILLNINKYTFFTAAAIVAGNCRLSIFNNTNQNDQGCVLFPTKKCPYAAIVPVGLLEKLCHTKWNLFSFMRLTCIYGQFLVKTVVVRRCAVYIIYWQYTLIFLFCSVTKFQNASCALQTKAKKLILNKSSILT